MSLADVFSADRRGIILRLLHDQGDFGLNDGVIQDALDQLNHKIAEDRVRHELTWLEEAGYIQIEKTKTVWLVNLTKAGEELATGRRKDPSVKRAGPRS